MDHPLPSPGFSIPSIGTPLHQPEEDQQILPHAYQQQQTNMASMTPLSMTPMSGQGFASMTQKHTYAPSFAPQTPQSLMSSMMPMQEPRSENPVGSVNIHQTMGPQTPMTPMTPGASDPGILPQLQ
jgi:transcription initiation factor TFIID TATA-box-binding protein